jgi:hypothetical protein
MPGMGIAIAGSGNNLFFESEADAKRISRERKKK